MRILIVDDDDFALATLDHTLSQMEHHVIRAHDGREAMEILGRGDIRLVITDWHMPNMDGIELCRAIRREDFAGYVYLIMLTSRTGATSRREGMNAGVDDFLTKPLDLEDLTICLKTAERILALETRDVALFALAKLAESRDPETGGHLERVQSYTRLLATHLSEEVKIHNGVDDEYVHLLRQTSPLHDLGKVGIPDSVLLKSGKLTPGEFEVMKTHTILGAQTLDAALQRFPNAKFLRMARDIAASHHEKFDGSGYPAGLSGQNIPFCGRLVALADVYDALTSRRVYKSAMTHEQARQIILHDRGTHFDPDIVDAFLLAEQQFIAVQIRLRDDPNPAPVTAPVAIATEYKSRPAEECGILVVEDSPMVLNRIINLLRDTGHPVLSAPNVQEATTLLDQNYIGLIVSDWEMPGASGVDLCARLRASTRELPAHFIMLTVHGDEESLLEAYKVGVDDFVAKPFKPAELLARVRAGLRTFHLREELARKSAGLESMNNQLAAMNGRLDKLAITDELTGLFNRRHAMVRLEEQWSLSERYGRPLSVAIFDIDHFKKINDTYGHDAGDAVMRQLSAVLRDNARSTDTVCRVGGEEFLFIFPAQNAREALAAADRCRLAVERHLFSDGGTSISITISAGVADRGPEHEHFPELLRAADRALYGAKNGGRNRVCIAESQKEAGSMTPATENPVGGSRPPINVDSITQRCGGDSQFVQIVMERFRLQAPNEISRIEQAIQRGDSEALRRTAHNLKSIAAYVTADAAAALCRQLEELGRANRAAEATSLLPQLRGEIDRVRSWIAENSKEAIGLCA